MNNIQKLEACFKDVFQTYCETLSSNDLPIDGIDWDNAAMWDSLAQMSLVLSVEEVFGIMFTTDQIVALKSFDSATEILRQHGIDLES